MQAFLLKVQVLTLICLILFAVTHFTKNEVEAAPTPTKIIVPFTSLNSDVQKEVVSELDKKKYQTNDRNYFIRNW